LQNGITYFSAISVQSQDALSAYVMLSIIISRYTVSKFAHFFWDTV